MSKFRIVIVLIVAVLGIAKMMQGDSSIRNAVFNGTVVEKAAVGQGGRDRLHVMTIKTEDGGMVQWYAPESFANYYQEGDFFVKLAGKDVPAVFRDGQQLGVSGAPYYLKERLNLADYKKSGP